MITVGEAYNLVWETLKLLSQNDVAFTVKPSASRGNVESEVEKLPPEAWVHVTFKADTDAKRKRVNTAAQYLATNNIAFDTSGNATELDWEIDWSFSVASDEHISEMQRSREFVSAILEKNT